jgi:hypothetical protein
MKNVVDVKFSNGDHLLAVLQNKGKSAILTIYKASSMELVKTVKLHSGK